MNGMYLVSSMYFLAAFVLVPQSFISGITVAEKMMLLQKTGSEKTSECFVETRMFNESMALWNQELKELYFKAFELNNKGEATEEEFTVLLEQIREIKGSVREAQELWSARYRNESDRGDYSLWHHPEGTVYDLISDYGGSDCIYLIPPNIGMQKIAVVSKIPVPRECWQEFLSLVLSKSGILIKTVSPLIKQLSLSSQTSLIVSVVSEPRQLDGLSVHDNVCYVFSSSNPDVQADWLILRKFINGESIHSEMIGGKLFLFGPVGEISEILKLYDFVGTDCSKQEFRLITLNKIEAAEMTAILNAAFSVESDQNHTGKMVSDGLSLKILPLQCRPDTLFVSGSVANVSKAVDLIHRLEDGIENPNDKVVFWYNVRHSDPEELAMILSQVYNVLSVKQPLNEGRPLPRLTAASPAGAASTKFNMQNNGKAGNFIVDLKTGTLIMVVEKDTLAHIKALLKKLDVSKKMIQIEVLLFERKIVNQHKSGLNLLRLGEEVCKKSLSPEIHWSAAGGILEFLLGGKGSSFIPGYDLAYQFLLAQEDIQINASPSIITMNQTPATIAIVEEISILVASDKDHKSQYNRAQYGITIKIVPTVNIGDNEDGESRPFITLDTDIMFDTTGKSPNDRPDVTRRHITNHVRIADGETVILGGLRRKNSSDGRDGLPFLGEIPGIGKLFSMSSSAENSTEMFIFITPKILQDTEMKDETHKKALLSERPGDSEELVVEIQAAQDFYHKKRLLEESKKVVSKMTGFDVSSGREYDGR